MPRFFFDVHDSFVSRDQEGTDLPSVIDARLEAVKFAGVHFSDRPELSSGTATSCGCWCSTTRAGC